MIHEAGHTPEEDMTVTFKGITQQMVDDWACAAIYKITDAGASAQVKDGVNYAKETSFTRTNKVGENVFEKGSTYTAPKEPGLYAIVLLSKWHQNGDFADIFVSALQFTVGNETQQGGNDPASTPGGNNPTSDPGNATGYPAEWPNAVPKMPGAVKNSMAMAENPSDGYRVTLGNTTIDEVMSYVDTLKSNGYTKRDQDVEVPFTNGTYANTLRNGTYAVGISFTDSNKEAVIYFLKETNGGV